MKKRFIKLIKTGLKEGVDWEWIFEENELST